MRVFLDVDEVVADFLGGCEDMYEGFRKCEQTGYALPDYIDLPLMHNNPHFWLNLKVMDVPMFKVSGYVSHRPFSVDITNSWVRNNGLPLAPVYHVNNSDEKLLLLQSLDADIYVDDKPETFEQCDLGGINTFLYDQPWNRHITTLKRIKNLNELKERLKL